MNKINIFKILLSLVALAAIGAVVIFFDEYKAWRRNVDLRSYYVTDAYHRLNERISAIAAEIPPNDATYEKLLQLQLEEAANPNQVADAYAKLAQLYGQKSGLNNNFKAINYASRALDLAYSHKRAMLLAELLHIQHDDAAAIGHNFEEITLLTKRIAELEYHPEKAFLLRTRLAAIYQLGRASELEAADPPQMPKALAMRKRALDYLYANEQITYQNVDIIMVIDDNYAKHAAVTIASILMNANPETYYKFHFVMDPKHKISPRSQEKLQSLSAIQKSEFTFTEFPQHLITDNGVANTWNNNSEWPKLIMYRLFLDQALPNLNKAIYLDADIIVNHDLYTLFGKNIDGYYLAAAADFSSRYRKIRDLAACSKSKLNFYFNSGMILFNFAQWRTHNLNASVVKLLHGTKCPLICFDQDVLNLLAANKTLRLANAWNFPEAMNYNLSFNANDAIRPFINHMYNKVKYVNVSKPWHQKDAANLWIKDKTKIHPAFWQYWAYREITK